MYYTPTNFCYIFRDIIFNNNLLTDNSHEPFSCETVSSDFEMLDQSSAQPSTSGYSITLPPSLRCPTPNQGESSIDIKRRGPKRKHFEELHRSSRFDRAKKMRENFSQTELVNALLPETKQKIADGEASNLKDMSNEERQDRGLAAFLEMRGTKSTYEKIRCVVKPKNKSSKSCSLPSYKLIVKAKNRCCPNFIVTNAGCSVEPQDIVDLNTKRLFEDFEGIKSGETYQLVHKYGMDSASGMSLFHQKSDSEIDEGTILTNAFVPLILREISINTIIWKNPKMNSSRLCRPLDFEHTKETTEKILEKFNYYESKLKNLNPTMIRGAEIQHQFFCTMLDGKAVNAITNTKSTECHICGATYAQIQDISNFGNFTPKEHNLRFGMPILHSKLKVLENIMNVAFKLRHHTEKMEIDNMDNKSAEDKTKKAERRLLFKETLKLYKENLLKELYKQTGLQISRLIQGKGTTNSGNVSRSFFKKYTVISQITGIDEQFLKKLYIILICTSTSRYTLNSSTFNPFAKEVYMEYLEKYGSVHKMCPTLHKLLRHAGEISDYFKLPISIFSEETIEVCHQIVRNARKWFSFKSSREITNRDIMRRFLIEGDPKISKLRGYQKDQLDLPSECYPLLLGKYLTIHKINTNLIKNSLNRVH